MNEEETFIRAFVIAAKRDRLLELLTNPRRRAKATAGLAHFSDLDPRWVIPLQPALQDPKSIECVLRSRGAGDTCQVISENSAIDGTRLPLKSALERVVGQGMGTLLSCVPGALGYFEGEGPADRCILARRAI